MAQRQLVWVYSKAISPFEKWRFFLERQLQDASTWLSGKKIYLPVQETQKTWVWALGQEDPLEGEMATCYTIFCLENPTDRGAWWATVHGVTKSDTQLSMPACCCYYHFWRANKTLETSPLVYRHTHFKSYNCISCQDVTKIKKKKKLQFHIHSCM